MIAYIRHELGLDKPVYIQFFNYIKGIFLHFNFGYSFYSGACVLGLDQGSAAGDHLADGRRGDSSGWLLGIPVGITLDRPARNGFLDRTAMGGALVFVSMPTFWLGLDRPVPVRRRHRQVAHRCRGPTATWG